MRPEDVRERLRKRPFQPIRLFLSDGAHYDVRNPDVLIVGRTEVILGSPGGNGDLPERFASIDPLHIVRIEPIDGRTS
jgi:hypothetical protein